MRKDVKPIKKASRRFVLRLLSAPPERQSIAIEKWFLGRQEFHQLTRADCVVVSQGKSGRTWLRVMLSRFYQETWVTPVKTSGITQESKRVIECMVWTPPRKVGVRIGAH